MHGECVTLGFVLRLTSQPRLTPPKSEWRMMMLGIVHPSHSNWASPLNTVKKSQPNDWRPSGDYCALNSVTISDRYPLPRIHGCVSSLHEMKVFSIIDLVRACHHIPVASEDVPKTARSNSHGCHSSYGMPPRPYNASSIVSCAVSTSAVPTLTTFSSPARMKKSTCDTWKRFSGG